MPDKNWMNGVRVDEWVRGLGPSEMRQAAKMIEDRLFVDEYRDVSRKEQSEQNWTASPMPSAGRAMSEAELLTHLFTYHNDPAKVPTYDAINRATRICAEAILHAVPPCADRTHALRLIRDVRMWANAAVACDGVTF